MASSLGQRARLGLLFGTLLLLGLGLEAGLRLLGYDPNPNALWRYDRTLGWTFERASESGDQTEALSPRGFRHRQLPREKPPGTRRLLVLGESFSAAHDSPLARSYSGLLESRLNETSTQRWEVLNLAVSDWETAQQLLVLQEIGLGFGPDAVVLQFFPYNDLCNNTIGMACTCSGQDVFRPYFVEGAEGLRPARLQPRREWLRAHLRLFALAGRTAGAGCAGWWRARAVAARTERSSGVTPCRPACPWTVSSPRCFHRTANPRPSARAGG